MKIFTLILLSIFIQNLSIVTFDDAMKNLKILETYIKLYYSEKKPKDSLNHLLLAYIREGKYSDTAWTIAGGSIPKDLVSYIAKKDSAQNTRAQDCRKYGDILLPSNEKFDFVHFFAVMNGIEFGNSYTDYYSALVGWGGDGAQLIQDIKNFEGGFNELYVQANRYLGIQGQFGQGDLIADLDAPIILKKLNGNTFCSEIMTNYYKGNEWKNRVKNFVSITFPKLTDRKKIRDVIYERYNSDVFIHILECQYGVRSAGIAGCYLPGDFIPKYENHKKAAIYAFADYLDKRF
jgi:hypothetical protein